MSDPRVLYYKELDLEKTKALMKELIVYAVINNLTFSQLEAYVHNNNLHREAALLNIRDCRNIIRSAVNDLSHKEDEKQERLQELYAVYAIVNYEERYGIRKTRPRFFWTELSQKNEL